jgi:endonuclease/exonuclease/phosphatase family metal-dependent hydrolase
MRLVTYNIQYGIGLDGKFDLARIADAVRGADVIALQEVTRNFMRNDNADLVAGLAELLPEYFHVFGPAMDVDFGVLDDAGRPINARLQFGNMVLARWQIAASRNLLLPRTHRLSRANFQRGALEALVITPDGPLRVYSVHLDHVNPVERGLQIRHLKERVYAYATEGGAISGAAALGFTEPPCPEEFVLMGDFNMIPDSPEYVLMTGEAASQPIDGNHPVDAFRIGDGLPAGSISWVNEDRTKGGRLIDFAFVEASLASRVGKVWIDHAAKGSDHLPVWLELG